MKQIFKKFSSNHKGFSFAETIISVFIFTVGLLAAIQLISSGLEQSINSKNQIIAGELAQEGVELIRNIRDNNWASGDPNGTFDYLPNNSSSNSSSSTTQYNNCNIYYNYTYETGGQINCNAPQQLYLDGGFYDGNASGTKTKFMRKIDLRYPDPNDLVVTSEVSWSGSMPATCSVANKCVSVQVTLTTWGGNGN